MPDDVEPRENVQEGSPPLQFGSRRLYYQYSVTIPQVQLVLASVLQGIVFTILLTRKIDFPTQLNKDIYFLFQLPYLFGFFFHQQYFYLPYIISALVVIIGWMDFVYATAVLIWPPTPLQAIMFILLTVAEIAMASTVSPVGIALWRSSLGLTTVVGGIMRLNNVRIFQPEDFEDLEVGKDILKKEKFYGRLYIGMGSLGVVIGVSYYVILGWVQALFHLPSSNADVLLHWIVYLLILGEIGFVLNQDRDYRQKLLQRLTTNTTPPLEVTPFGGIRHKREAEVKADNRKALAPSITTPILSSGGNAGDDEKGHEHSASIQPGSVDDEVGEETEAAGDIATFDRERLYHLWEKGQWSASDIDLALDRIDWQEKLTNEQRFAIRTIVAMFLDGEQVVARDLAPFIRAASQLEDSIFLTTQIADEGRHHVFFDRFLREVMEIGHSMDSTLAEVQPYLNSSYKQLFAELNHVTDQLHLRPNDTPLLAEALVFYHLMAEGVAHSGQHFLGIFGAKTKLLPGFTRGINLVARDESRHIAFGLRWLRELVATNPECRVRVVQTIKRALPWVVGMLFLPEFVHSLGVSNREACIFTLNILAVRFRYIGISPTETPLVWLGHVDSPEEQADSLLALMECGVFSSDGVLHMSKEAMDIIFDVIRTVAERAKEKNRGLHAAVQWIFDEITPRYLVIGAERDVRTEVGRIAHPDLTLRITSNDWVHIMLGQLHPLSALRSGRLRIRGDWSLAFRLSRILSRESHTEWSVE